MIEDAGIPSMFAAVASTAVHVLAGLENGGLFNRAHRALFEARMKTAWFGKVLPDLRSFLPHLPDPYDPEDARTEAETVANIFFFNCMGQDEANGTFGTLSLTGTVAATVDEALMFSNSDKVEQEPLKADRFLRDLLDISNSEKMIRTAYRQVLLRAPQPDEVKALRTYVEQRSDRPTEAIRQVVWAMMTSTEFRFNY